MPRWPLRVACAIACPVLGCSVQPGLANGPLLGGTRVADARVHDAIANGPDVCGRDAGRSPLRGHIPHCPRVEPSAPANVVPTAGAGGAGPNLVVPWLEHYYAGWPCSRPASGAGAAQVAYVASCAWP